MVQHAEREIREWTRLCDKKGNLNPAAIGYAKNQLLNAIYRAILCGKRNGIIGAVTARIFYFP